MGEELKNGTLLPSLCIFFTEWINALVKRWFAVGISGSLTAWLWNYSHCCSHKGKINSATWLLFPWNTCLRSQLRKETKWQMAASLQRKCTLSYTDWQINFFKEKDSERESFFLWVRKNNNTLKFSLKLLGQLLVMLLLHSQKKQSRNYLHPFALGHYSSPHQYQERLLENNLKFCAFRLFAFPSPRRAQQGEASPSQPRQDLPVPPCRAGFSLTPLPCSEQER